MRKTTLSAVLAIAIAAVFTLGSFQSALAVEINENGWASGRQGVFMPNGFNQNNVTITQVDKEEAGWAPVRFHRKLLDLRFRNNAGQTVDTPYVLTYIYFNLNGRERVLWDQGDLGIWYWDKGSNTWQQCNAFLASDPQAQGQEASAGSEGGQGRGAIGGRLACAATQFTLYGLGSSRSE